MMKKNKKMTTCLLKILSAFILLWTVSINAFSQNENSSAVVTAFTGYQTSAFEEKVFLHTDKTFYVAGEIIWFKAYTVDGDFHKPTPVSKVLYVEVISQEQKAVLQVKVAIDSGKGNGSITIPPSIATGNYLLRAYTSWMKNFSPDFYFEQPVTIINTQKGISTKPTAHRDSISIGFFPEGGNLVYGLSSKIACKVSGPNGLGVDCSGAVINQKKDTVARFRTLRFGMGSFTLTPLAGEVYTAVLKIGDSSFLQSLPAIYKEGYVMGLSELENDQLRITVTSNTTSNKPDVLLFVHNNQLIKLVQENQLAEGKAFFIIPKKSIGDGIVHFTIFNAEKKPVCERLYFKKPLNRMIIHAKTGDEGYAVRKKVTFNLQANDLQDQPVKADLSMSVFRIDSLQDIPQENILTYLWLGSELKGRIEQPGYYFEPGTETGEATDNLMLTQGWRRFKWEDVIQDKKPLFEFLPETEGPLITGRVFDKKTGEAVQNKTAYLSIPGSFFEFRSSISRQNGTVRFNANNFYGHNEIIVQTNGMADSNYSVDIANPFSENFSSTVLPALSLSEKWRQALVYHSTNAQVENSYLIEKKRHYLSPEIKDSTSFYGKPDRQYALDDFTRFNTMEEVMREFVLDVRVRKQGERFYFRVMNDLFTTYFEDGPMVLIDGLPVFDVTRLMNVDPLKIKQIDVVAHKYTMGSLISDGIVSYKTYNGDLGGYDLDPAAIVLQYEGLQQQREFYTPVYESAEQSASRIPDFRNVLQWSPSLKTGADGKQQLSFYTSDLSGKFAIAIQGITEDGLPGSYITTINVHE